MVLFWLARRLLVGFRFVTLPRLAHHFAVLAYHQVSGWWRCVICDNDSACTLTPKLPFSQGG